MIPLNNCDRIKRILVSLLLLLLPCISLLQHSEDYARVRSNATQKQFLLIRYETIPVRSVNPVVLVVVVSPVISVEVS